MSGFHPNIVLACIFWLLTLGILIHAFWIYEKTTRFSLAVKSIATAIVVLAVVSFAWRPVLKEYQRQHPSPSFAFVLPGVVLYGQAVGWMFLVNSHGIDTLYNVQVYFRDIDRVDSWKGRHSLSDEDIQRSQLFLSYPEIDPGYGLGFARQFQ